MKKFIEKFKAERKRKKYLKDKFKKWGINEELLR